MGEVHITKKRIASLSPRFGSCTGAFCCCKGGFIEAKKRRTMIRKQKGKAVPRDASIGDLSFLLATCQTTCKCNINAINAASKICVFFLVDIVAALQLRAVPNRPRKERALRLWKDRDLRMKRRKTEDLKKRGD
mmetsp:Transcript_19914/g.37478  ORF Transcript_19914/g.37478 Transcript_19914/m.37478 type:complete len:134 (+) Transcript_19914:1698-2099(+)